MKRRLFLKQSSLLGASFLLAKNLKAFEGRNVGTDAYYKIFQNPLTAHKPFVRWWWNGNKINKNELLRELTLLKEAGIGGVEINPISFPKRTDDMGIPSLRWLSKEWIDMVQYTANEAKKMGMTTDLIVGSGWPFGAEDLREEETAQVVLVHCESIEGPLQYSVRPYHIFNMIDPAVTDKNPLRNPEILAIKLVKDPMVSINDAVDYAAEIGKDKIEVTVPTGKHVVYFLVKFKAFASVINGAPGAAGSILNHMDKTTVTRYLERMSTQIQQQIGPLKNYVRALFTDSMELEGCNWCDDFAIEFQRRRGYDITPYLPFILFKVGRLGAVVDENYGAKKGAELSELLNRVRFDYEYTKACLLKERFTDTYVNWCRTLGVKSRAQAYGRGFFPLESSLEYDIPEGESWTTNYLRHKLGEEMSDEDYRRGRGYTMIDKYVSSAAHLKGKRLVSCEEMTNTYLVFNTQLELLKLGSDQSALTGITHSVWHGFNYSPLEAPFPGWIQYGSFYNERNNWWPYFHYLNAYKARLSSQLQAGDYYADMAILPANYDLWTENGVQTDPFPEKLNVPYTSLLWEAISKNGGNADYITEIILQDCKVEHGKLCYGKRKYGVLFLPGIKRMSPESMSRLLEFVQSGGRVVVIENLPQMSLGLQDREKRDAEVQALLRKLQTYPNRFIAAHKPEDNNFMEWYHRLMQQLQLPQYLRLDQPNRYVMQMRYIRDDGSEFYFIQNAHRINSVRMNISFIAPEIRKKTCWLWDLDSGTRSRVNLGKENSLLLDLGPTDAFLFVFDNHREGPVWQPLATTGSHVLDLSTQWKVELKHKQEGTSQQLVLPRLIDFKEDEQLMWFSGTAIYQRSFNWSAAGQYLLNLGKVAGVSEVFVNGQSLGVKWYGRRIYDLAAVLKNGENQIEVRITTTMGNYLKTLKDNENAQYWVNRKGREQEIQSMGLIGPVTLYTS
ncbi:glycosyl hydrolase [Sphingobacterium sp.]|uniref:glycosyl hydrolase n=1 Tax=Sphingobacterium sp. TaxID=341027 RepID=UPI002FDEBCC8